MKVDYFLWINKAKTAEKEAHKILSSIEGASSRVVYLNDLFKKLGSLPVDVNSYFTEALGCLEKDYRRASVVLSWAGFFEVFLHYLYSKKESEIRIDKPKWTFADIFELKENYPESQILDVAKNVKVINKSELKIYQGQLAFRNQCAHPTLFQPSQNNSIGFVDSMINQTKQYL